MILKKIAIDHDKKESNMIHELEESILKEEKFQIGIHQTSPPQNNINVGIIALVVFVLCTSLIILAAVSMEWM